MKRHLLLIMLSLGLMAVTGCKKSPSEEASDLKFLSCQEFTYVFEPDAGEATLQFDAAQIWMAAKEGSELENEWLTLTPAYGQGGPAIITIGVAANPTESERTAVFMVTCGKDKKEVTVRQYSMTSDETKFVYIPDENFREYCLSNFDLDGDKRLSKEEALAVTEISCEDLEIKSLSGIKFMTNLQKLNCRHNLIEGDLDLSGFAALKELQADHNVYTSLNLSGCSSLETLKANDNYTYDEKQLFMLFPMTSIDLTGCSSLKSIDLQDNGLLAIDCSDCPNLEVLNVAYNSLNSIDVSKCTKLAQVSIRTNKFNKSVDFSHCPNLTYLGAWEANLTGLNVSGCTKLQQLIAYRNPDLKLSIHIE